MVALNFGNFSKVAIQDGLVLVPTAKLEFINPLTEKQEAKGLISLTTKSGEIMWVHLDIVKDEQWESSQPKLKGKSCNVISLAQDDDKATVASFSSSEEEKFVFAAQPATSQPVGTGSSKQYLWQYNQTPDETQQPRTLGNAAPVQVSELTFPLDKEK